MPAERLLGKDRRAVYSDLEDAAGGLGQLDHRLRVFPRELGRQTGGPGLVVSDDAVFDTDLHDQLGMGEDRHRHVAAGV